MPISNNALNAAQALFRQERYHKGNLQVSVRKDRTVLSVAALEIAELKAGKLRIMNGGNFGNSILNTTNAVLRHAGHEMLYRKSFSWMFENSQTPYGSGLVWKPIKL